MISKYVFTLSPTGSVGMSGEDGPSPVRSRTLATGIRSIAPDPGALAKAFADPFLISSEFPEASGVRLCSRPLAEPAPLASLEPIEGLPLRRMGGTA